MGKEITFDKFIRWAGVTLIVLAVLYVVTRRRIALGCWMIDTGARMLPDVPCPCGYMGP